MQTINFKFYKLLKNKFSPLEFVHQFLFNFPSIQTQSMNDCVPSRSSKKKTFHCYEENFQITTIDERREKEELCCTTTTTEKKVDITPRLFIKSFPSEREKGTTSHLSIG